MYVSLKAALALTHEHGDEIVAVYVLGCLSHGDWTTAGFDIPTFGRRSEPGSFHKRAVCFSKRRYFTLCE